METKQKKKLFISGPVTGVTGYREAFEEARAFYESAGYVVLTPTMLPAGMANADYERICMAMIDCADEVAFLPGWRDSAGAKLEHDYCYYTRKPVRLFRDDLDGSESDNTAVPERMKGAIDITCLIEKILSGEKDDDDAFDNVMDFAVGQALQDGYIIDFATDGDGWKNITLRPMPRLPMQEESKGGKTA